MRMLIFRFHLFFNSYFEFLINCCVGFKNSILFLFKAIKDIHFPLFFYCFVMCLSKMNYWLISILKEIYRILLII